MTSCVARAIRAFVEAGGREHRMERRFAPSVVGIPVARCPEPLRFARMR
jgi:hypothetical protein